MGVGASLYMYDVVVKVHVRDLTSWWVIVCGCQRMANVANANGAETLLKISTGWVRRTNVTNRRQTDRQTTDGRAIAYSSRSLKIIFWHHIIILYLPVSHYYWQHCAQLKPPVFNLLRGRFWGFSPRRGDTAPIGVTFWHGGCDLRSPPPCQISPHQCNDKGVGPQRLKILLRFDQNVEYKRPQERIPCAIFTKFAEFVPHFRCVSC